MSDTTVTWRPASQPPDQLVDVLLHQGLPGFDAEDMLIRIGYRNREDQWVDSYSTRIDGADDHLEHITHWAPLPAAPQPDGARCPTPWPGDDHTVEQCVARGHCWCGADYDGDRP